MYFSTSLITLLTATTLPLITSAAALDTDLVAKSPFSNVKGTKAAWDRLAKFCAKGRNKRDLDVANDPWPPRAPAGFTTVNMGESKAERDPLGLWTYGLVTCFGVGVTGTQPVRGKNERVLMHFTASGQQMAETQWGSFKQKVDDAKLSNKRGYLSLPDTTRDLPPGFNNEDKELSDTLATAVTLLLTELTGSAPRIVRRAMKPAYDHVLPSGTMSINKDNQVQIDGRAV